MVALGPPCAQSPRLSAFCYPRLNQAHFRGLGQLWVWNTGPGIPLEEQERIFERFYRGEGDQIEGNGLGLAIVRSIAQAHAGRAFVEGTPDGDGSRFVIELPLLLET